MNKYIEKHSDFYTTHLYWDCECVENYIHPSHDSECDVCHFNREDDAMPDSRVGEILAHLQLDLWGKNE